MVDREFSNNSKHTEEERRDRLREIALGGEAIHPRFFGSGST